MLYRNLAVDNGAANLLLFNPGDLISTPYNDAWTDHYGRQYFWPFFKSIFVGEYEFGDKLKPLTVTTELLGLVIIAMALLRIVSDFCRRSVFVPMVFSLLLLIAAVWLRRIMAPFSCNQDFRFIPIIALPLSYYSVNAIKSLPGAE